MFARPGVRSRTPVVAAVIIGSLGVGIGVNTTVFSWIESQVLNPMPGVLDGGSFRLIEPITGRRHTWLVVARVPRPAPRLTTFSDLIAFRMAPFTIGETDDGARVRASSSRRTTSPRLD